MLRRLLIKDFVLVDELELDFRPGFGALTGETGAGKSILLDALALLLGERGDAGVVRGGCDKADLAAEFDLPQDSPARHWLIAHDFNADDECVLLRRVIDSGGRSRAYINGMPATAAQLRELGDFFADIHGQHAHHALLRADAQRILLDSHAGLGALVREVGGAYREWQAARRAREEAERGQANLLHEREMLAFQVKELSELGFAATEWEALNQEQARLSNAAALMEGASSALDAVVEGETPIANETERLAARLQELATYDPVLGEIAELFSEASIRLEEAGHALRRYRDRIDLDPARLSEVDQRMASVLGMARKYRLQPDGLPALLQESATRLANLDALADLQALSAQEQKCSEHFDRLARKLSQGRRKAASALATAVTEAMQGLAMAGGRFDIVLQAEPEGTASGYERVEFQVAANPQQTPRPLAKVASGGELSRIGLAIQVITSEAQSAPTLIFDEVDVGIGGSVAEIVGRRLRELGRTHQVLCVTHLPQVAAQADWQWKVAKETVGGDTLSRLSELDEDARIEEIARMLGGINITETTRSHAAELLGMRSE